MTARVAMYVDSASLVGELPYGRDVAVESFLEGMARSGREGRYLLFHSDGKNVLDLVNGLSAASGVEFEAAPVGALIDNFRQFPFAAWHDPDADIVSAVRLRGAISSHIYPITATGHVLSYQGLLHGWITHMLLAETLPCDAFVCTSRAMRRALSNLLERVGDRIGRSFGGQLHVIPYSIDTRRFRPRSAASARRVLGLEERAFTVLWIGRLSAEDKADLVPVLRVFRNVIRSSARDDMKLVIAGWGTPEYETRLRATVEDLGLQGIVEFLGKVEPSKRHLVHAAADVFLSTADNIQETFGITPLEALASGVPQVVSDWNGYRDIVVDGETGFLIPTYWGGDDGEECRRSGLYGTPDLLDHLRLAQAVAVDTEIMQRALVQLVSNDDLRSRMAEASRARALALFAESVVFRKYEELWDELGRIAAYLEPSFRKDHSEPAFMDDFRHYASRILESDDIVVITSDGSEALEDASLPPLDRDLGLKPGALFELLRASSSQIDLKSLEGGDAGKRRQVLWLLKHGLLRLG